MAPPLDPPLVGRQGSAHRRGPKAAAPHIFCGRGGDQAESFCRARAGLARRAPGT
jgi:hypothetical protein